MGFVGRMSSDVGGAKSNIGRQIDLMAGKGQWGWQLDGRSPVR